MKNKILGGIVLFLLALGFIVYKNKNNKVLTNTDDIFVEEYYTPPDEIKKERIIIVCITGEIQNPGTYEMAEGTRVKDLVNIAGGLKDSSDTSRLNLARKLIDEDLVVIPAKVTANQNTMLSEKGSDVQTNNAAESNTNNKINLNTASSSELISIPGIGKVTAEKIIKYREEKGFFSKIEQLMEIDRIGEATFNKIKDYVEIY